MFRSSIRLQSVHKGCSSILYSHHILTEEVRKPPICLLFKNRHFSDWFFFSITSYQKSILFGFYWNCIYLYILPACETVAEIQERGHATFRNRGVHAEIKFITKSEYIINFYCTLFYLTVFLFENIKLFSNCEYENGLL